MMVDANDIARKRGVEGLRGVWDRTAQASIPHSPSIPCERPRPSGLSSENAPATKGHIPNGALQVVRAADIQSRPVEWVWKGRLARGKITIIAGDPGLGKSQTSVDVTARITNVKQWPDGGSAPKGSVVILSAEDAANDTIVPRLPGPTLCAFTSSAA